MGKGRGRLFWLTLPAGRRPLWRRLEPLRDGHRPRGPHLALGVLLPLALGSGIGASGSFSLSGACRSSKHDTSRLGTEWPVADHLFVAALVGVRYKCATSDGDMTASATPSIFTAHSTLPLVAFHVGLSDRLASWFSTQRATAVATDTSDAWPASGLRVDICQTPCAARPSERAVRVSRGGGGARCEAGRSRCSWGSRSVGRAVSPSLNDHTSGLLNVCVTSPSVVCSASSPPCFSTTRAMTVEGVSGSGAGSADLRPRFFTLDRAEAALN